MNGLQGLGAAIVKFLWKIAVAIILVVFVAALVSWARGNPRQAQATTNKVMNAGASVIGWAADGVTGMTGGQAAEAGPGGPQVIYVQSEAPGYWGVGQAIKTWNKGLTNVQLKAGDCVEGATCITVSQVSELPDEDGRMVLGKTTSFFGMSPSIRFNGAAVHHVRTPLLSVAACHELGHALGLKHRTTMNSCMHATVTTGVSKRPDAQDYAAVNDKYGN